MAKHLVLKYAGKCVACGAQLDAGTEAIWWSRGRVSCIGCDGTMTPEEYAARREAKADRYQSYADNARARGEAAYQAASRIGDMIPFGQPILVGHHSEGRHRRDINRIERSMRKSIDEHDRAEYWQRRANAIANDRVIHADDPEAADKLRAKIAGLEAERERIKLVNKIVRKAVGKDTDNAGEIIANLTELTDGERKRLLTDLHMWYGSVQIGYPGYVLSNLGGNIKRYKQRLATIEKTATLQQPALTRAERNLAVVHQYMAATNSTVEEALAMIDGLTHEEREVLRQTA